MGTLRDRDSGIPGYATWDFTEGVAVWASIDKRLGPYALTIDRPSQIGVMVGIGQVTAILKQRRPLANGDSAESSVQVSMTTKDALELARFLVLHLEGEEEGVAR